MIRGGVAGTLFLLVLGEAVVLRFLRLPTALGLCLGAAGAMLAGVVLAARGRAWRLGRDA